MYCENCGNQLRQGIKFCSKCGKKIEIVSQEKIVPINEGDNISLIKEFDFKKTFLYATIISESTLLILFGYAGMFNDAVSEVLAGILGSLLLAVLTGLTVAGIISLFKNKNTPKNFTTEEIAKYNGLGGWLILIGFSLIISTLFTIADVWINWESIVDISVDGVILLFSLWLCYLFFSKKKIFPKIFIASLAINVLLYIIGIILNSSKVNSHLSQKTTES